MKITMARTTRPNRQPAFPSPRSCRFLRIVMTSVARKYSGLPDRFEKPVDARMRRQRAAGGDGGVGLRLRRAVAPRPEHEAGAADDELARQHAPGAAVPRILAVVAGDEVTARGDDLRRDQARGGLAQHVRLGHGVAADENAAAAGLDEVPRRGDDAL